MKNDNITNECKCTYSSKYREGLELAHRASNANLVCVKPESIPKLIERGWGLEFFPNVHN